MNRILVRLLRFCLCRRVSFAQSSYWLINSYPAPGVQIVESATLHYLKAWNKPISSCFLLSFAQILAETRLNVHDSPFPADAQDTVATFSAPPDPTGKVYGPRPPLPPPPRKFSAFPVTDVTKRIGIKALITNTVTFRCNLGGENRFHDYVCSLVCLYVLFKLIIIIIIIIIIIK